MGRSFFLKAAQGSGRRWHRHGIRVLSKLKLIFLHFTSTKKINFLIIPQKKPDIKSSKTDGKSPNHFSGQNTKLVLNILPLSNLEWRGCSTTQAQNLENSLVPVMKWY